MAASFAEYDYKKLWQPLVLVAVSLRRQTKMKHRPKHRNIESRGGTVTLLRYVSTGKPCSRK